MVRARRGERLKADEKALFSGAFWTGTRALEMGLIDGLGDLRQVMREKYSDDVRFRLVDDRRPWWRRRFQGAELAGWRRSDAGADLADGLIAAVEERLLWNRFGL